MNSDDFAATVRRHFPDGDKLARLSNQDVVEAFAIGAASGNQHIIDFLRRYNIDAGWFRTWMNAKVYKKHADALGEMLRAATTLHEMDNLRRAHDLGVPRASLGPILESQFAAQDTMTIRSHETTERLREAAGMARIEIQRDAADVALAGDAARMKVQMNNDILEDLRKRRAALLTEITDLALGEDPNRSRSRSAFLKACHPSPDTFGRRL